MINDDETSSLLCETTNECYFFYVHFRFLRHSSSLDSIRPNQQSSSSSMMKSNWKFIQISTVDHTRLLRVPLMKFNIIHPRESRLDVRCLYNVSQIALATKTGNDENNKKPQKYAEKKANNPNWIKKKSRSYALNIIQLKLQPLSSFLLYSIERERSFDINEKQVVRNWKV